MHRVSLFAVSYVIHLDLALYSQDSNRYSLCSCMRRIPISPKFLLICIL